MQGTIDFKHDEVKDIIIATPNWNLQTKEDCDIWFKQWVDYMTKFNRKMDAVMILDNFNVSTEIAAYWGEYRAKVNNDFTRFSYRVNPNLITGIFIKTSGVRYNASSKEANSVESAIVAILDDRKKANIG